MKVDECHHIVQPCTVMHNSAMKNSRLHLSLVATKTLTNMKPSAGLTNLLCNVSWQWSFCTL